MPSVEPAAVPGPAAWRRIAWRSAGICGAAVAALLPPIMLVGWPLAPPDVAALLGNQVLDFIAVGLIVSLTLQAVESVAHWPRGGRHALLALGIVVATCVPLTTGGFRVFDHAGMHERLERAGIADDPQAVRLHLIWFSAILASVSSLYLLQRRESVEAEQRLVLLEAQWQQASRRVRVLRDTVGAARLDPQVLFNCMGLARREYLRDAPSADALLDRLIDFLRGSVSATRSARHTLGHEVDQARHFAAILALAGGVRVVDAVPPALRPLEICPSLLLPLVQQWLTACEELPAAGAANPALRIDASIEDVAPAVLRITLDGPFVELDALLAESRDRLNDLHGRQASVRAELVRLGAPSLRIRFELPLESSHVA